MGLGGYIFRRLLLIIPTAIGLSILTFIISHMVPGDPVRLAAGPRAGPKEIKALRHEFGFDKPLHIQYLEYMKGVTRGDLGRSVMSSRPVVEDLRNFFPATLELILVSMVIALVLGIPIGLYSAAYSNRWIDHLSRLMAVGSISFPIFWVAILLQVVFAWQLGWFPVSGRFDIRQAIPPSQTNLLLLDTLLSGNWKAFPVVLRHIALPALCQSLLGFALVVRMLRTEALTVLSQDFVRVAYAKGLGEQRVLLGHVLRNALIPTISMVGFLFGFLLGGSVLIEAVFDWPGIGLYVTKSALTLDFQPIMGITLFVGVLVMFTTLFTDILYGVVDPRIRHE
ncbi:MAG: ABC transporter permease [Candidatus Bipolaricaulia bacterium]